MKGSFGFLILMFTTFLSMAQRPVVTLWGDTQSRIIGEVVRLNMEAVYPKGLQFELQYKPDTSGKLEWLRQGITDSSWQDNNTISMRGYIDVMAFDSGSFTAGPVFLINSLSGDTSFSNTVLLRYNLAAVDTAQDIKPISGLMDVPFTWQEAVPYIIWGLVILAILAGVYLLYRWLKKRPKILKDEPEQPKIPLHERTLLRLTALEQAGLWQAGREKEYQSELTTILREYIEERYLLPAMESTSAEILETFGRQVRDMHLNAMLERCLTVADYVKFAKGTLTGREHELAMESAREFVLHTTPAAERSSE